MTGIYQYQKETIASEYMKDYIFFNCAERQI